MAKVNRGAITESPVKNHHILKRIVQNANYRLARSERYWVQQEPATEDSNVIVRRASYLRGNLNCLVDDTTIADFKNYSFHYSLASLLGDVEIFIHTGR